MNVQSFQWHESMDMIAAIGDGKFISWIYPNVLFVDPDIASITTFEKDITYMGSNCQIASFWGSNCMIKKFDGTLLTAG